MDQSNSKLDLFQKEELAEFKKNNKGVFEFIQNPQWGFTLLLVDSGDFYKVSASYMGEGEKKFRKKVGQYWTLYRLDSGKVRYIEQDTFNTYYRNNPAAMATLAERIVFNG